ncbi:amino-acid N-acetyltransferase protein [Halorhabdus tiamatea SARL4B]|uniref:Amino-acid N-acetyltransferase protein n=1 Tax=Halorhabdus tiamatea SARL4B TaxID=1033806 RepID=F7PH89_9EURY|nr:GNAT family N-acetyltransferase [Halorhabdus tiamatea]ERJ05575.1 amino-acid N-acetyltransferase protein [Halorhabdus tiamatea SARL4B]CCQ32508.1 GCN5-related N-acetyltransferease [Halorhabdus tiamatea SARL4B]
MPVTIREATGEDVPSLEILRRQAIEDACSDVYDRERFADLVASPDDRLPSAIESDAATVLLAETTITPVSFAIVEDGTIEALYTSPEYQHEGHASALLEDVERLATDRGWSRLEAVAPSVAVGFFEAQGFTPRESARWHGLPGTALRKAIEA